MTRLSTPALFAACILVFSSNGLTGGQQYKTQSASDVWRFSVQLGSGLSANPLVQAMVDSVSADQILSNLDTLVGFYTRHTNSDTTSPDTGIGAARRWIFSRFQAYAADPGAVALQPSYFTFNATICAVNGDHRNVLAMLPGMATPDRNFISMGHMDDRPIGGCDAVSFAPGANDDGSGTVVTMEMARVMSQYEFESTVILMPVTGEDEGLFGSTAYAEWAVQQGLRIDGVLTNDVVGNVEGCVNSGCPPGEPVLIDSTSVRHFSGEPATGLSRQLSRYIKLRAMQYVPDFTVNLIPSIDRPGRGGDHIPFYDRGYAAVRFTEPHENGDGSGSNGRQHNVNDTISAFNTNKGYMANIARISIAGMASLALAPETPQGLEIFDIGDGQRLFLTWPAQQTEPDFAGYRIAVRDSGELFYTSIIDVGNVNQDTLVGLTKNVPVFVSISAYDTGGNESIFSIEVLARSLVTPMSPANVASTSFASNVFMSWDPNIELDVVRYRVYRSLSRNSGFVLYDSISTPASEYTDFGLAPQTLYFYRIGAVDADGFESPPSITVAGQLVTRDLGILVIDGTRDGSGTPFAPTDSSVDAQYYLS